MNVVDRRQFLTCLGLALWPSRQESFADLFLAGQDGYHTFRIPALARCTNGALIAICEGRKTSRADHGDVDLVMRRSVDGGKSWGPVRIIYELGGNAKITIGNPCPVVDYSTGVVWLPFCKDNSDVLIVSSDDHGASWTAPRDITSQVKRPEWSWYATGPGNGIQLRHGPSRGRLVIPCDHRLSRIPDRRQSTRSHVIYSDDHGKSWTPGGATEFRMNECAVVELSNGNLLLNMRSNRAVGKRAVAVSNDGGQSWGPCRDSDQLVEPVCQASLIRHQSGVQPNTLVFCNPAATESRHRLTLRLSYDEGRSWPAKKLIYAGSSAYSSLVTMSESSVGLLFERDDYSKISFCIVKLEHVQ